MRIVVIDLGAGFGGQTRAYAEYRVFTSLARFGDHVDEARVSLTPPPIEGQPPVCRVAVATAGGRVLRVSARGRHVYEAIDRAAQRTAEALRRHAASPSRV
jgi:ribosome-associated translation inhibitor RaiA